MSEAVELDEARRKYEFKKMLERLEAKEGSGTELISLYIPPDKQIYDVTAQLRDEFGQCSNIKSKQTRTNVQSAISSILSRLKYYSKPPENGIAVFCGTVNKHGDRQDLECDIVNPPEPLNLYLYRCSSRFELEPLREMLEEKYVYGLLVIDRREAYWGFLRGNRIDPIGGTTSTVPGKQRKGGQSSIRFERLRLIAINEFYKKVGERSSEIFINEKDFFNRFKGLLIGGPSPTKEEFEEGNFLHHEVQKRIIGLFDVAYTNESGLPELVEAAEDALKGQEVIEEKHLMDRFFKELVKDNGLAAYGEQSIRANLEIGAVDTLLLSDKLRKSRLSIRCDACGYTEEKTVQIKPGENPDDIELGSCPKCTSPLVLADSSDIVDELTYLADQSNSKVAIISDDFEEGSQLFTAFGGIAAILRYRTGY
ncbi:peptide chain release factor aRF-1 [Methanospirillum sp. J.3.6.1-F.2.7.3]|jgi:peptide chain release factor subunit 1|uniref:Peptide chain release factor subunit 1 n=2 Tax=Methanospirillum TaxID=2202 RepID=A0A8E7EKA4_9EURY|nr:MULTISPECIES: peptide chain release factor aRF-1 [Methanospirillum]MDX8551413.1 peptide chain release factor aRF-1 [Methanospirillum hungatei]NLW75319.1 peptide chain release factor 1 [Methanomicrobiales archaeon]QVV89461.1 peptide chain release factor aRF-1 [Methanospirillum sp. J.3.6.1-F.2.7.3]QXO96250.1 peptide chain release factor aRF-1 [Methanospirillum hungatei]